MEKIIVFDLWGDYGHFRNIYTTTSPLSYAFPPRTALSGLIAAVAGRDKEQYIDIFTRDKANIALRILSPVKKVRFGENLIDTKTAIKMHFIKGHTQIRFEFIKDPKYRVYFRHSDNKFYKKIKMLLEEHKCVYTPCLGLSEFLCNFKYRDEYTVSPKVINDFIHIDSVIPKTYLKEPKFEPDKEYFSVTIPIEMKTDRTVRKYDEVLYERRGKQILARVSQFWEVENGERILFL